jgi:hypothetical protein
MSCGKHLTPMSAAVLVVMCVASQALAKAPAPVQEQDVLRMFTQRESERTVQQWLRGYSLPPVSAPYDLHSLERQLWYSQWWLRQQEGTPPAGETPHCQPPYYMPPPPFRYCPDLPLR